MSDDLKTVQLEADNEDLRERLEQVTATLDAIRNGEVDGLVVAGPDGDKVYTLDGAEQPYRVLIESMQQGAAALSAEGTVLYCNRCFAAMLEMPMERVIGGSLSDFVPLADQPCLQVILGEAALGQAQREIRLQRPDGTILPVSFAINPLPLKSTLVFGLVVTDLTQQKQYQDLQDADRRKDEFLAMLAHELRNPLAPIRNAIHVLRVIAPADAKLVWVRDVVERQVQHMTRLVDDLLDVSRITSGKIKLQKEPTDVAALVAHAVETARPLIEARKHELTVSIPPEPVRLEGDPVRLAQVIGNLLHNSAKYSDEGQRIWLTVGREKNEVVIKVRDTGIGIPAEMLPRVFDLFSQADHSLDRSQGGLGIGLTLVRSLVEMHGGSVQAFSGGSGKGSEFVVRLPAAAGLRQGAPAPQDDGRPAPPPSRRILVVDDNVDGAESLALLLKMLGHAVFIAHNGPAALESARTMLPEIILLDIGLPGMNGYEVARKLRQQPEIETVLLVAVTGYGQEEDRRRSKNAGFDRHLVKPLTPDDLDKLLANPDLMKQYAH